MRQHLRRAALLLFAAHCAPAMAQDLQLELSVGGGIGSSFTRSAPFEHDGVRFAGPYRTCPIDAPDVLCAQLAVNDVNYGLESKLAQIGVGGAEVRRRLAKSWSIGAGVLGGLGLRKQRLLRGDTGQVVAGRPLESDEILVAAESNLEFSTDGIGVLAYAHGGLRFDRGFENKSMMGYRRSPIRVFLEVGAGGLAAVPGGGTAEVGHPPGIHAAAGLTVARRSDRALSFSVRHVRALGKRDEAILVASQFNWTVFQVGWIWAR